MRRALTPCLISVLVARWTPAQTVVTQGEKVPAEFRSPMVIETPLFIATTDPSVRKTGWIQGKTSLRSYVCDNVFIANYKMKLKDSKDGLTELAIEMVLSNLPGHDKDVTLVFEVLNGEDSVATFRDGPFEVKEGKWSTREARALLPRTKLIGEPLSRLRITMKVVDD
jgi:hypothetical protein